MSAAAYPLTRRRAGIVGRFFASRFVAVMVVALGILAVWYAGSAYLNAPFQRQLDITAGRTPNFTDLVKETWAQNGIGTVLPAPHQIAQELYKTVVLLDPTSKRSLVYHGWITLSSTLAGFVWVPSSASSWRC